MSHKLTTWLVVKTRPRYISVRLCFALHRYVKMPLKIRSPNFFILIHKKLSSLRIDGRDMSVKFPEQLNIALNGKCCS